MTVSLMNQPTPLFHVPATALYGERGPQRSYGNLGRKRVGSPASLADHIDALKHVADLTPRQRLAVHNEMTKLCREVAESARGPWSEAAVRSDEGRRLWPPKGRLSVG
jgi:hypothetical protein